MTKNRRHTNTAPESLYPMTDKPDVALVENYRFADSGDDGSYPEGGSAFRGDDGVGFGFGSDGERL